MELNALKRDCPHSNTLIRGGISFDLQLEITFYGSHDHGWASAELPQNRVNVNLFLCHILVLSR